MWGVFEEKQRPESVSEDQQDQMGSRREMEMKEIVSVSDSDKQKR